jgi:hypothetical protein
MSTNACGKPASTTKSCSSHESSLKITGAILLPLVPLLRFTTQKGVRSSPDLDTGPSLFSRQRPVRGHYRFASLPSTDITIPLVIVLSCFHHKTLARFRAFCFSLLLLEARKHDLFHIPPPERETQLDSILGDIVLSFFNERQKERIIPLLSLTGK